MLVVTLKSFSYDGRDFVCRDSYEQKIKTFAPKANEENRKGIYRFHGYRWLTRVVGTTSANFLIAIVPGSIPMILTISAVDWFFRYLRKEKGILGAYVILSMAQYD